MLRHKKPRNVDKMTDDMGEREVMDLPSVSGGAVAAFCWHSCGGRAAGIRE